MTKSPKFQVPKSEVLSLHTVYANNFELFEWYDSIYNIAARLGYKNAKTAWRANPNYKISVFDNKLIKISKTKKK